MTITWNDLSGEEWLRYFSQVPRPNLLQSLTHARAVRFSDRLMTRFGAIRRDGNVIGLVQIQEIRLFSLFHVVTLDRGPLWLKNAATTQDWLDFIDLFDRQFPRRFGRMRRIMPEADASPVLAEKLQALGLRIKSPGYQSIWLDLDAPAEKIRKGLKQKWRNRLNAAERASLAVENAMNDSCVEPFIRQYAIDRLSKRYRGPSPKFVRSLVEHARGTGDCLLLQAKTDGDVVAAILVLKHGNSATYQVGWSNEAGRQSNAHYLLIWRAIELLKAQDVAWLDLGGINDEAAEGVSRFKRGIGGKEFQLIGLYA